MTLLAIKTVMAIVIILASEIEIAIVIALAIETNIHGYYNRFGHQNWHLLLL